MRSTEYIFFSFIGDHLFITRAFLSPGKSVTAIDGDISVAALDSDDL